MLRVLLFCYRVTRVLRFALFFRKHRCAQKSGEHYHPEYPFHSASTSLFSSPIIPLRQFGESTLLSPLRTFSEQGNGCHRLHYNENMMDRILEPEQMDDPNLEETLHAQALEGLRRINRISGSAGILWPSIRSLTHNSNERSLRILDIAAGAGDVPIALWRKAGRAGLTIELTGSDRSLYAVEYARRSALEAAAPIRFFTRDVSADGIPGSYDVLICSLFLHHLHPEDAERLLRAMAESAARMVLINDLVRSQTGLWAARLGTSLLTRSSIVRVDGPRSVRAAFTIDEVHRLAQRAGLTRASVIPRWPFRFLLVWRKR